MSDALATNTASVPAPSQRSGRRRPRVRTRCHARVWQAERREGLVRLAEDDALDPAACTRAGAPPRSRTRRGRAPRRARRGAGSSRERVRLLERAHPHLARSSAAASRPCGGRGRSRSTRCRASAAPRSPRDRSGAEIYQRPYAQIAHVESPDAGIRALRRPRPGGAGAQGRGESRGAPRRGAGARVHAQPEAERRGDELRGARAPRDPRRASRRARFAASPSC